MAAPVPESDHYKPRARTKHVVTTVGNKMYVWGGWTGTDQYSRVMAAYVEIFDFTSGIWNCKKTSGSPPSGLIDSAYACVGGSKLYVFGGYDGMLTKRCTNDLHQLDLNTFEWKKVVAQNYLDIVDNPRPMHGAKMFAHGDGRLVMYGGVSSTGQNCGDVFVYEIYNGIWEKLATTGNRPPPLNGHTLIKIDASRAMLFGGQKDDGSCINDVYILSVNAKKWTKMGFGLLGAKPASRTKHSTCCIASPSNGASTLVLVTGGKRQNGVVLDDFWIMDLVDQKWKQIDVGDQEKPRHSHCTVMFGAGIDRIVTVSNGGQDAGDGGQPLGLATPYLINSVFHLEKNPHSQDWNVTKMIYKPKDYAVPTPLASASTVRPRTQSRILQDHLRDFGNQLNLQGPQPQVQERRRSQSPQRREDFVHGQNSLPERSPVNQQDRSEVVRALNRADEMERRAMEAEQNLFDALQQLTLANDKVIALKKMVEDAHVKAATLQQKVQAQQEVGKANYSQTEMSTVSTVQNALDTEECATSAKIQLTQAEVKIDSLEAQLTKAKETELHLQQELSAVEQRATQADHRATQADQHATQADQRATQADQRATQAAHRATQAEQHATQADQRANQAEQRATQTDQRAEELSRLLAQMERRAIEAEASTNQAERSAQLSQHQAFNSEMRAREAERRRIEAEEQLRDANTRTERAERRAAFVDRGEERMWALERDEIHLTDTELGRGGWAVVKIAEFRGIHVAAKCIYNNILSEYNRALFMREMNMAARLRHPNLVQFIGATIDGEPLILMELLPTTLRIELRHGPPTRDQILSISKDVGKALNYMHLIQPDSLIHRDVSSANVLLEPSSNNTWKGKLSDYGSVNFVQMALSSGPGNPSYAAPEANRPELHSPKMDVYSYGVLLSEMCSGRFPDTDRRGLVERVADEQMANLVGRCLANERDRRPTMSDVLEIVNAL